MSKSIKNCFYKKLTFESLLKSHDRAKKNKTNRYELLKFSVDIETNIVGIMNSLKNGSYRLGKYKVFTIYEYYEKKYDKYYVLKLDIKKYFYNIDKNI